MAEKLGQIKSTNADHSRAEQPFDVVASENQGGGGEEVEVKAKEEMKPWEQHSAVISIPRFDYSAPSSILSLSHSGFLVTCPIKREKSATKEAILMFEKHISLVSYLNSENFESMDAKMSAKRRKICASRGRELDNNVESKGGECGQPGSFAETKMSDSETSTALSLVKLTRSGLLLFVFRKDGGPAVVDIVSNIIQPRESGSLNSPQWCHRIFPIQATCNLDEEELHNVISKLVQQFLKDERNKVAQPVKFAVGYNRRGIEENEMKRAREASNGSSGYALLDRNKCFSIVAAAVKDVVPDSVVNLKCPELAVLVEVLPLSGIPSGRVVVGVSVLPQMLVSLKPRLCIKALVNDAKAGNEKVKE